MRIDSNYKVRNIADEHLLIMQSGTHTNMTKVISLNATALELFNAFSEREFETDQVVQFLIDTFGIDLALAQKDAQSWISKLSEAGVIRS